MLFEFIRKLWISVKIKHLEMKVAACTKKRQAIMAKAKQLTLKREALEKALKN